MTAVLPTPVTHDIWRGWRMGCECVPKLDRLMLK